MQHTIGDNGKLQAEMRTDIIRYVGAVIDVQENVRYDEYSIKHERLLDALPFMSAIDDVRLDLTNAIEAQWRF